MLQRNSIYVTTFKLFVNFILEIVKRTLNINKFYNCKKIDHVRSVPHNVKVSISVFK